MSEYIVQSSSLQAVANKIREKTGDSAPLEFPDEFVAEINKLFEIPSPPTDALLFYSTNEFAVRTRNTAKNWDGIILYSLDYITWNEWDGITDIIPNLNKGFYRVYLRGLNNTYLTGVVGGGADRGFVVDGTTVKCIGNLYNLIDYTKDVILGANCCAYLFEKISNVDFADLIIPAKLMGDKCFYRMFSENTLSKAPALPATALASHCYENMFQKCPYLKKTPDLPATELAEGCYYGMFSDCTSLETIASLPATILADQCYVGMFQRCTKLTTVPSLLSINLAPFCYYYMFFSCTALNSLPELPATELTSQCYYAMFQGCTRIKLSTTQTGEYQTEYRIPLNGTGTPASSSLTDMFKLTTGTFTGTPTINTTYYTSNTVIPAT